MDLSRSNETDVRLEPSVGGQSEASFDSHFTKAVLLSVGAQKEQKAVLQSVVVELRWRQNDVLSRKEFVFQPIVVELLELLEGQQRSLTHSPMILREPAVP